LAGIGCSTRGTPFRSMTLMSWNQQRAVRRDVGVLHLFVVVVDGSWKARQARSIPT
jgi:hypothetical protein